MTVPKRYGRPTSAPIADCIRRLMVVVCGCLITISLFPETGYSAQRDLRPAGKPTLAVRTPPSVDGWPLARRDAQNSGYRPQELRPPLRLAWRTRVPSDYQGAFANLGPLASSGIVCVLASNRGTQTAEIRAYEAATGKLRWRMPRAILLGSIVHGQLITHREKSRTSGTAPDGVPAHTLVALDLMTGKIRWEVDWAARGFFDPNLDAIPPYPMPGTQQLLMVGQNGITVNSSESGRELKKYSGVEKNIGGTPALQDDLLVLHQFGDVEARGIHAAPITLDARSLEIKGHLRQARSGYRLPMLAGEYLINAYGNDSGAVNVHRREISAQSKWIYSPTWSVPAIPRVAYVVVPHRGGYRLILQVLWDDNARGHHFVRAYELSTGKIAWEHYPLAVSAYGSAAGRTLYLPGESTSLRNGGPGGLYALDTETGKQLWKYERHGLRLSTAAIAGDCLFTLGKDGYLYAFSPEAPRSSSHQRRAKSRTR